MKPKNLIRFVAAVALSATAFCTAVQAGQGPQPNICNRSCWTAAFANAATEMAGLTRAVIHHSAGSTHFNTSGLNDSKSIVRGIQSYHMNTLGWLDIGYHFLADKHGNIFEGRRNSIGSRPRGSHDSVNSNSMGFNLLGYLHSPYNHQPTGQMRDAIYRTIAWKMPSSWSPYGGGSYGGNSNVGYLCGHRNVKSTSCPGDTMYNPYITGNLSGGEARNQVNFYKNTSATQNNRVGIARTPNGGGYWIVAKDGGVFSFGNAQFYGSLPGVGVNVNNIVAICARPQGDGYWLVGSDGGIFSFGNAPFKGSMGGTPLNQPIVGMACTQQGTGYWLVAKDGGIFSFNAPFYGSLGGSGYSNIVGIGAAWHSNGGNGYWIVRSGGHIYSYNASYYGGGDAGSGIVGIAPAATGTGYWQVRNNGNIYSYNLPYHGGANEANQFVAIARGPSNGGYWLLKGDGAVYSFGSALYHGGANF